MGEVPDLDTELVRIKFPDKYSKLINRLRKISRSDSDFSLGETLGDLVSLSTYKVSCLPGVGKTYVDNFEIIKTWVERKHKKVEESDTSPIDINEININELRLCALGIDENYIKPLEKFSRHAYDGKWVDDVGIILGFSWSNLKSLPTFGTKAVENLVEFRGDVENEIELAKKGEISFSKLESNLLVPRYSVDLSIEQVDLILLDDIEEYFEKISDEEANLAQQRWGFVLEKLTLEEIANKSNLTRERVRQKEVAINKNLLNNLKLSSDSIWSVVNDNLDRNIENKLKDFFSCFYSKKDFYEFLGLICEKNDLYEYVYPIVDKNTFNDFFAENGAPAHIGTLMEYMDLNNLTNSKNSIFNLEQKGVLIIEGDYVWPLQLSKSDAAACVLVRHKDGLPWSDVAKLVNKNNYSRTNINEDRLDTEAFKLTEYVFLSGNGVYKNICHIDIESSLIQDIALEVMIYSESEEGKSFHLNQCYTNSDFLKKHDYFLVRYVVSKFGEDFGLYFSGKSRSDTVGIQKEIKNITQKDVILSAMCKSSRPLTKFDVANLLKSKSSNHASFYLDKMIDTGQVVQVDRMLYTTPENAYKSISLKDYVEAIESVLHKYKKPIEPSIIKEDLNSLFSESYSKYFYASIARLYAKEKGWFRKQILYSAFEIPYENLNDSINCVCSLDFTSEENIKNLQEIIAIPYGVAMIALKNWRNSPVNK